MTENPSACIAEDLQLQETEVKEDDENEVNGPQGPRIDLLVLGPEVITYSAQDMHEREQEWQEVHQQELIDVQRWMQVQLDAQAARYQRQGSQGNVVYPHTGVTLMGQLGLSATALTLVLGGQGDVDMRAALYNSTPCASEQMQPMGSDFRIEPENVYTSFQQEKLQQCSSYGDHQIADPMAWIGPEE